MKDPCSYLRRESKRLENAATRRDSDNRNAVIEYLKEKGLYSDKESWKVYIEGESTPWGSLSHWEPRKYLLLRQELPEGKEYSRKNLRIKQIDVYEKHFVIRTKGKRSFSSEEYELLETIPIPNWDYSGQPPDFLLP